jgi:hypothetical protein
MGKRDTLYLLQGEVEFDEGYFEKATSKHVKLKGGRGSQRQAQVTVMAESTPLEDLDTGVCSRQCRYFKMNVINNHNADTVTELVKESFDERSIVFSDKSTSYMDIAKPWKRISPRSRTRTLPERPCNGCISQSVTQSGHCWAYSTR